jgi:hypothetical protein
MIYEVHIKQRSNRSFRIVIQKGPSSIKYVDNDSIILASNGLIHALPLSDLEQSDQLTDIALTFLDSFFELLAIERDILLLTDRNQQFVNLFFIWLAELQFKAVVR